MKKTNNILLLLFTTINIFGQNTLKGKWIEKNNINNPFKIEIFDYYFTAYLAIGKDDRVYHLEKDTFIFSTESNLIKWRFEQKDNELKFYNLTKDSVIIHLERDIYKNYVDYFNSKKNTSIEIPQKKYSLRKLNLNIQSNIIFVEYNDKHKLRIFINGENCNLNDFSHLLISKNNLYYATISNYLFIDKSIKLSDLQTIENQFRKINMLRISYVCENFENKLFVINRKLPFLMKNITDTIPLDKVSGEDSVILSKIPPPPIPPQLFNEDKINYKDFYTNNILCKIDNNKIEYNGIKISNVELFNKIKQNIKTNNKLIINVYFDNKISYDDYLSYLINIRKQYYEIRNEYSKIKYDEENYENLDIEIQKNIKNKYPMRIRYINKGEYEDIKKNAH